MQQEKTVWKVISLILTLVGIASSFFFHFDARRSTKKDIDELWSINTTLLSEKETLQSSLSSLQNEMKDVQSSISYSNERSEKITRAEAYAIQSDYATAIPILSSIIEKTEDVIALLEDYSLKYEMQIVMESDNLVREHQFDEAISAIDNALHIIPNSPALTSKRAEVESKKPVTTYLVDTLTPYTSKGFEVITGALEMGGERYKKSFTLKCQVEKANVIYNLKGHYSNISFTISVIQSSVWIGDREQVNIWLDDELIETIDMSIEDIPQQYTLDLTGVKRLKFEIPREGPYMSLVGVSEAMLSTGAAK